jgi:hypothetical protein
MRRLIIRNVTGAELGVMVEPWTGQEDVSPGGSIVIEGSFGDEDLIIDIAEDTFVSVWGPADYKITKVPHQLT